MSSLSPSDLETLSTAVGDRFDFDALNVLLFKTTGDSVINEIAARSDPTKAIARRCLDRVDRDGFLRTFLAFVVDARRSDQPLRDLIFATVPDAAKARPTAKEAVSAIVAELYKTNAQLDDPVVLEAVSHSRAALQSIGSGVLVLQVYKNFHDCLHQLQVRRFETLLDAARTVATDPSKLDILRNFQDRMQLSHATAEDLIRQLQDTDLTRAIQMTWIDQLGQSARMLEDGLNQMKVANIMLALHKVNHILETDPSQINRIIFEAAKALPLTALDGALDQVSKVAGAVEPGLAKGAAAVRDLRAALTAKVVDHTLWQEADDTLWAVNQLFLLPQNVFINDFGQLWPLTKSLYETLASMDAEAAWAKQVRDYQDKIDATLTEMLVAESTDIAATTGKAAPTLATVRERFDNYRAAVRLRFFVLDSALAADCAALLAIGDPIQAILTRLVDQDA